MRRSGEIVSICTSKCTNHRTECRVAYYQMLPAHIPEAAVDIEANDGGGSGGKAARHQETEKKPSLVSK